MIRPWMRILALVPMVAVVGCARAQKEGGAGLMTLDVTAYGAVADGKTLNTAAMQKAIDACSAGGGGMVVVPAGKFLTGTIQLKNNVMLHLAEGAVVLGSPDAADYRNVDPFIDGNGHPLGASLVVAVDAEHVGIDGPGMINGQGQQLKARQSPYTMRPFLVRWVRCNHVVVREARLMNPGAWTLNFFQTKDVVIEGITIRSRDTGLANNDGINIDSSEDIHVRHCDVDSGDDALVIKSTSVDKPCRNIDASDCKLSTKTNAIKLGTESIGGFENISVTHCQVSNTRMSGIALYTVDGGDLKNVRISDVTMDGVMLPISVRLGARLKTFREGEAARKSPGVLRDVVIRDVTAKNVGQIGMLINGVPGHPVEDLTLESIRMELPGGGTAEAAKVELPEKEKAYPEYNMFGKTMPAWGMYVRHVRGLVMKEVEMKTAAADARPEAVRVDVEEMAGK